MSRGKGRWWKSVLAILVLSLVLASAKYLIELRNYKTLTADPCILKSPNECAELTNGEHELK